MANVRDHLHRFWFEFEWEALGRSDLFFGVGVTAFDEKDARTLLSSKMFGSEAVPEPKSVICDVDVSELDPGHVRPQVLDPSRRGIWFPRGFD